MTKQPAPAVATVTEAVVPVASPGGEIGALLRMAVESKVDVGTIERLVALRERMEDRSAAAAFNRALMAFQGECPPIVKNREAKITTRSGGAYAYRFADLDQIARTIRPLLERHGLSYSWDSEVKDGKMVCTCIVRHIDGHAQSAHFTAPTDSDAAMSGAQKFASALTYARRQSLVQALGLTITDEDDDGAEREPITDQQAMNIEDLIQDSQADRGRFLVYMGVGAVSEIAAADYDRAIAALQAKQRKVEGGAS